MKKGLSFVLVTIMLISFTVSFAACNDRNAITCSSCGEENPDDVKFCSNCGVALNRDDTQNDNNNNGDNNNNSSTISTTKEFLNSIANDTTINLSSTTFEFQNVYGLNNSFVEKDADSENGYIISGVNNLTITGDAVISIENITGTVLTFKDCENITILGIDFVTPYHDEESYLWCLAIENCTNFNVDFCSFNNADSAININDSKQVSIKNSSFEGVAYSSVSPWFSDTVVENCTFKNCQYLFNCRESTLNVNNSNVIGTQNSDMITDEVESYFTDEVYDSSVITFNNCTFKDNSVVSFIAKALKEEYAYEHETAKFNNCKFENNIYCNGSLTTQNFVDCTLNNNQKGIEILDFSGWDIDSTIEFLDGINYSIEYTYTDLEADCKSSSEVVVSQSVCGIVSSSTDVILNVSQPAITIEQINIEINSVGGVETDIKYTNHSDKQIAYIYFTIKYYDRMGYAAYCKYEDSPIQRLKVTGPVNAGETDTSYWDPIMYNSATAVSQPQKIEVVFADGTKQTITCTGRYWYTGSYYGGDLHE